MKTLRLTIALLALVATTALSAQTFGVKGSIVSASDSEPEAFATVRVYAEADTTKALRVAASSEEGIFSIDLPAPGAYRINIHSVGKADFSSRFALTDAVPVADLGQVCLKDGANELGEVSVLAQRPLISKEIDRLAYDVKADEEAQTSSLREVLTKVPMVTVDSDGTVKVKGSTNFKIYKNGRPNNAFTNNAKDIFAAIPAASIKKIEVITDPGAREDAEGVDAILNIVTDTAHSVGGATGTIGLSSTARNLMPGPDLYLTSQLGKVTFSLSGGYRTQNRRESKMSQTTESVYATTGRRLRSESDIYNDSKSGWVGLEASYEPDTLNLFTVELDSWIWDGNTVVNSSTTMLESGAPIYSYRTHSFYPVSRYFDLSAAANYQHSFRRKGETLTLSYQISATNQRQQQETDYSDMVNFPEPYTGLYSNFDLDFKEQTLQIDWARPLGEHHKLDIGGKYVYRDNHSTNTRNYVDYQELSDHFRHLTQIGALFADYRLTLGKWSARAGLRYEYSHLSARFIHSDKPSFGSHLNDWVPNAAISFNATESSSWKLSYNRRISRPGISYLDPSVTETPQTWSAGNPDLESAVFNQFGLEYSLYTRRFNINANVGYSFSNNMIGSIQWTDGNRTFTTYANAYSIRRASLSLFAQWTLSEKTSLTTNAYLYSLHSSVPSFDGATKVTAKRPFNGHIMLRCSQKLPWDLLLSGHVFFMAHNPENAYTKNRIGSEYLFHSLDLQRSFLKEKRLTVRVGMSNPFGPYRRTFRSTTEMPGYSSTSLSRNNTQTDFYVHLSYRFGSLNAAVKKTSSTISNDDLEGRKVQ